MLTASQLGIGKMEEKVHSHPASLHLNVHDSLRFEQRRTSQLNLTVGMLVKIVGGHLVKGEPSSIVRCISTDTRHIVPGDTFFALRGERFDANNFIHDAVSKGASVIVTSNQDAIPEETNVAFILVKDTNRSFLSLASWYRKNLGFKTICITGSCGKTSTKELIASMLRPRFNIISTYKNFNNLVGVPITILNARRGHHWAVLELGMNQPGEIGTLSQVAGPDIGVVTNVCPAHLEGLGDLDQIAREKASLLFALKKDGVAIVNLDDPKIAPYLDTVECKKIGFTLEGKGHGSVEEIIRLASWRPLGYGIDFEVEMAGLKESFFCGIPGLGNLQNLMAAISVGIAAGIPLELIKRAISSARPTPGRLYFRRYGNWLIIDDTYNANPTSMKNALSTLAFWSDALFRCAILGDMLELGEKSQELHYDVGRFAASSGLSMLLAVGRYANAVCQGALQVGMSEEKVMAFKDLSTLNSWLRANAVDLFPSHAWILVKGSRGMQMEKAIEALTG